MRFNPLRIGASISRRGFSMVCAELALSFQSPSHRGKYLTVGQADHSGDPGCVSIPFASGQVSHTKFEPGCIGRELQFQSPSHRGKYLTRRRSFCATVTTSFQSPSHRGKYLTVLDMYPTFLS